MANEGLVGAILLALGGAVLFFALTIVLYTSKSTNFVPDAIFLPVFFSFIGFLVFGLGLSLILQTGKSDTK